jgi:hypothetical protein
VLKKADHFEQVRRSWIACWAEHSHETLSRNAGGVREFRKADGRVDVIAQDGLGGRNVAVQHRFETFAKQRSAKLRVALDPCADRLFEITCEGHGRSPVSFVCIAAS